MKYKDKYGKNISEEDLKKILHSDTNYKYIDKDLLNGVIISTIWTPVSFEILKTPFETKVFKYDKKLDKIIYGDFIELVRYETIEEAQKGHDLILRKYLDKENPIEKFVQYREDIMDREIN